jgi:hypothetical protein
MSGAKRHDRALWRRLYVAADAYEIGPVVSQSADSKLGQMPQA